MTHQIREELAHHPVDSVAERRGEAAAVCRFAGALHVLGGDPSTAAEGDGTGPGPHWVVHVSVGAVARRLQRTLVEDIGIRPMIEVHRPSGLRRESHYRLALPLHLMSPAAGEMRSLRALGLAGPGGALVHDALPPTGRPARLGWLRGAAMAAVSVSAPRSPPHLELNAPTEWLAQQAAAVMAEFGAPSARAAVRTTRTGERRHRAVIKSGEHIGAILAVLGAHHAFLERDLGRLERGLRSEANRTANADRANLDRAATAAARQIAAITAALERLEDQVELPEEVLQTVLARLANPGASMAELGVLLDPPVGRATVHRRIRRLLALAEDDPGGPHVGK